MYKARKMLPREFEGVQGVERDAEGNLRHFAVEAESGQAETRLSWPEACAMARERNEAEAVA